MSSYRITIRNYRSIPLDRPLVLPLNEGVTFVLGVNNAGKTNLLKFFYELRGLFAAIREGFLAYVIQDALPLDALIHRNSMNDPLLFEIEHEGINNTFKLRSNSGQGYQFETSETADGVVQKYRILGSFFSNTFYIPPLRSLSAQLTGQHRDVILGQQFIQQWDNWANGNSIRQRMQVDALKGELRELFQFNRFDIQASVSNDSLWVTTDDGTFRLEELGDGISHFIFVLGNVMMQQPNLILIDEPENGLHPRMQEVFIRTLSSRSRFGLLAASHAVGLARSAADHVFSLTRDSANGPHLSPFGEHHPLTISQSLTELGYSQFAEIGGNHLLLVEGRTDVKAFREILRKYGIEHHFIIWSLGGSEFVGLQDKSRFMDELNELRRLNPKSISVIFDSERTSAAVAFDPRFQAFYEACKELGFQIFPTEVHSTENYLKQPAIDALLGTGFKALQPFERFGSVGQKWDKNKNWLMFREMKKDDFKATELDKFITATLIPLCK